MQRDGPDLTFLGFFLLAVFGSLVWNEDFLSSNPPNNVSNESHSQEGSHTYDARLWQDPFEFKIPAPEVKEKTLLLDLTEPKIPTIKLKETTKNSSHINDEEKEKEKYLCHKQFKKKVPGDEATKKIKILAPAVIVGSKNENKEQRIRKRYAVVAGLSESGYTADNPTKLNYCFSKNNNNELYDIRWEYYTHKNKAKFDDVLLIWLNNDKFFTAAKNKHLSDSIEKNILELLGDKFNGDEFQFNILGPTDSDTLKKITNESDKNNNDESAKKSQKPKKFNVYSPFATAKNIDISNSSGENFKLLRTIGTDNKLIEKLIEELKLRNIKYRSEVAIIAERDTSYSREMVENFCNSSLKIDNDKENCNVYNYLRGMDANQGTSTPGEKDNNQGGLKKSKENFSAANKHSPPIGPNQLDYLRRMADEIKDLHNAAKESNIDTNKPIKAIGIFGTDIYDTLLILQALQHEFQNMLFFTTDLNAQMIHPQNFRWTRNLIVASNFDLSLRNSLQKSTPPFRDSYQTSLYLSTRIAVDRELKDHLICIEDKGFSTCNPPLLFEIGRNGPVRLEHPDNAIKHAVHPELKETSLIQQEQIIPALFLITLMLVFALHQVRPNSSTLTLFITGSAVILFSFAFWAASDKTGDPLSFTDGVSLWPTILIRIIVIILVFAFIFKAIRDIEINFERLSEEYFDDKRGSKPREHPTLFVRPESFTKTTKQWDLRPYLNDIVWVTIFIAAGIFGKVVFNQPLWALTMSWVVIFINWFGYVNYIANVKSINPWVEKSALQNESVNLKTLWKEYYEHGRLKHRMLRAVSMWLVFMAITSVLFSILSPVPPSPCRGDTCSIDSAIFIGSFTLVMLLIFFAIDALRLCFYWMKKLRTELILHDYENKELEIKQIKELRKITTLVAERTNDVDKLIYYPLIVIILMLFARSNYFDNIAFPLSISIIAIINIVMLIAAGLNLRLEAQKLKTSAIRCINQQKENNDIKKEEQQYKEIDRIVSEIQSIQHGAYQPMRNQPVMRTLLLVLGSAGLAATEYLMLMG